MALDSGQNTWKHIIETQLALPIAMGCSCDSERVMSHTCREGTESECLMDAGVCSDWPAAAGVSGCLMDRVLARVERSACPVLAGAGPLFRLGLRSRFSSLEGRLASGPGAGDAAGVVVSVGVRSGAGIGTVRGMRGGAAVGVLDELKGTAGWDSLLTRRRNVKCPEGLHVSTGSPFK